MGKTILVRDLDPVVFERIRLAAFRNKRSINQEVKARLTDSLDYRLGGSPQGVPARFLGDRVSG